MKRSLLWMVSLIVLAGCSVQGEVENISQVCFEEICFDVEVADTDAKRQQWLMFREELWSNSGMLFVFETDDYHSFWMKNTLIPLDMIWIDREWEVVDIQTAEPCIEDPCISYVPQQSAQYVLEINADYSQQLGIKKWSIVDIK